ncbi:MAG: hypothetical protein KC729_15205, partial [Candidatus Eisenbacteria bacterium]|nr:hypothetical protein [Candidatus Eisenbacteria bacterium]
NAFEDGFAAVWRGRRMAAARRGVIQQSLEVCSGCDINLLKPVVFDPRNPPAAVIRALESTRGLPESLTGAGLPALDTP